MYNSNIIDSSLYNKSLLDVELSLAPALLFYNACEVEVCLVTPIYSPLVDSTLYLIEPEITTVTLLRPGFGSISKVFIGPKIEISISIDNPVIPLLTDIFIPSISTGSTIKSIPGVSGAYLEEPLIVISVTILTEPPTLTQVPFPPGIILGSTIKPYPITLEPGSIPPKLWAEPVRIGTEIIETLLITPSINRTLIITRDIEAILVVIDNILRRLVV